MLSIIFKWKEITLISPEYSSIMSAPLLSTLHPHPADTAWAPDSPLLSHPHQRPDSPKRDPESASIIACINHETIIRYPYDSLHAWHEGYHQRLFELPENWSQNFRWNTKSNHRAKTSTPSRILQTWKEYPGFLCPKVSKCLCVCPKIKCLTSSYARMIGGTPRPSPGSVQKPLSQGLALPCIRERHWWYRNPRKTVKEQHTCAGHHAQSHSSEPPNPTCGLLSVTLNHLQRSLSLIQPAKRRH